MRQRILAAGTLFLFLACFQVGSLAAPGEEVAPEERGSPSIHVRFEAPDSPVLSEAVPVVLAIERDPSIPLEGGDRLNILLRLPVGVKLVSEGWAPVELPQGEKRDGSGPWFLFEREEWIADPSGVGVLVAQIPISLSVAEEGINWVITSRVRLLQGQRRWQAFGVIFATRQGERIEFHTSPKGTIP